MISVRHKGNFNNFERFCNRFLLKRNYLNIITDYAERGIEALKEATPVDGGETAAGWGYEIEDKDGITTLTFTNSNINDGVNVAILLIYGHATKNGGYVEGNNFVPATLEPIFRDLAAAMWKEVTE